MSGLECPICGTHRFYYVMRTYEYWSADVGSDKVLDLIDVEDSVIDNDFDNHWWCEDCQKKFEHGVDSKGNVQMKETE